LCYREAWHLEHHGGDKYSLRSHHGRHLCAEQDHRVNANRENRGDWYV